MNFDYEDLPCHDGHITIDAFNYLCGGKYCYDRPSRFNRVRKATYLRYTFLKDVKCEDCKRLKYEELSKLNQPTVISAVCEHKNEIMRQGDGFVYVTCKDCGKEL